jgi:hypothetical protein
MCRSSRLWTKPCGSGLSNPRSHVRQFCVCVLCLLFRSEVVEVALRRHLVGGRSFSSDINCLAFNGL